MPGLRNNLVELLAVETLNVLPWQTDHPMTGWHDPRDKYTERYWLPILGPSTSWIVRRLADCFDYAPDGFDLDVHEMARSIGLTGTKSHHDPFHRALARLVMFDFARVEHRNGENVFLVRRRLPPLSRSHVRQLPEGIRARYEQEVMDQ